MSEQPAPTTEAPAPETTEEPKTFNQDEVNRIVADRLKREREKFGDVEELRQKAKDYDALQEQQKSELQRAADQAAREKERADKLEETIRSERTRNAVTSAAAKADFHDPEDAFRLLDASDFEVDEDGMVRNLDKLISNLAKDKPHLIKGEATSTGSGDGGPRGKTTTAKTPGEQFGDLIAEQLGH
jgi:formate-dependent nitrite reductase cytochrome c552 subunit